MSASATRENTSANTSPANQQANSSNNSLQQKPAFPLRFVTAASLFDFVLRSVGDEWLAELTAVTEGKCGYQAIAAALDAHIQFCEDAPKHVAAFYRLWFESLAPESPLKNVILGIHRRRHADVVGWIEQGMKEGTLAESIKVEAVADHFTASISGIVYHWMCDPENLSEMRTLHRGLKQVMATMLSEKEK